MADDNGARRQLPPWLLGLLFAIVIFVAVLVAFEVLGFGDDPAIESMATGALIAR